MPAKNQKKRRTRVTLTRTSEVLDVKMVAELLTVSADTAYDLFKRGELPGRKVGRKWLTPPGMRCCAGSRAQRRKSRKGKRGCLVCSPTIFFKIVRIL
jgi:excisionase family DNA binding protein